MAKKDNKKETKKVVILSKDDIKGREEALKTVLKSMEQRFGAGSVMRMGDQEKMDIETIKTGAIALDRALGVGGIPKGRITEIYGPESSGKTTVALHIVAECQREGGVAAFIDAEHALDPLYAQKIGVDIENLLISQPDNGEQALEICDALVRSGAVDIIIVDSVAALTPRVEIEGDMGDSHVGILARLMSQALRKLTANASRTNTTLVFINQIREKIGNAYGNPETTTGGRALKFYSSVRLEVRRGPQIKKSDQPIGNRSSIKIVKNKVAPPFRVVEFDVMYGEGISKMGNLIDVGVEVNVVKKSGAWYSFNDVKLGQGRDKSKEFLAANPEVAQEIENLIMASDEPAGFSTTVVEDSSDEDSTTFVEEMSAMLDDTFMSDDTLEDL